MARPSSAAVPRQRLCTSGAGVRTPMDAPFRDLTGRSANPGGASYLRPSQGGRTVASRAIAFLTTASLVAAMIAPAFGQSSGGSTGTGSAPATGSAACRVPPAPSATQPGSTPTPKRSARPEDEARRGGSMVSRNQAPSTGGACRPRGGASGASKSGMSTDAPLGQVKR
jgi:hypothetical protein